MAVQLLVLATSVELWRTHARQSFENKPRAEWSSIDDNDTKVVSVRASSLFRHRLMHAHIIDMNMLLDIAQDPPDVQQHVHIYDVCIDRCLLCMSLFINKQCCVATTGSGFRAEKEDPTKNRVRGF